MLAVRLKVEPRQTGVLLPASGAEGVWKIVTLVVPGALGGHPPTTALTEYVPLAAVVTLVMLGFCKVEVNPFGPDHEYAAPETVVAFRLSVWPEHTGLDDPADGEEGEEFTTTAVVPAGPVHPFTVTVTE